MTNKEIWKAEGLKIKYFIGRPMVGKKYIRYPRKMKKELKKSWEHFMQFKVLEPVKKLDLLTGNERPQRELYYPPVKSNQEMIDELQALLNLPIR